MSRRLVRPSFALLPVGNISTFAPAAFARACTLPSPVNSRVSWMLQRTVGVANCNPLSSRCQPSELQALEHPVPYRHGNCRWPSEAMLSMIADSPNGTHNACGFVGTCILRGGSAWLRGHHSLPALLSAISYHASSMSSDVVSDARRAHILGRLSMPPKRMARPTMSVTLRSVVTLSAMVDTAPDMKAGSSCRTFLAMAVQSHALVSRAIEVAGAVVDAWRLHRKTKRLLALSCCSLSEQVDARVLPCQKQQQAS